MSDEKIYQLSTLIALVVLQVVQRWQARGDKKSLAVQLHDHSQVVGERMDERDRAIEHLSWLGNGVIGAYKHAHMIATARIAELTTDPTEKAIALSIAEAAREAFVQHQRALENATKAVGGNVPAPKEPTTSQIP